MAKPEIIGPADWMGHHNTSGTSRLEKTRAYEDLSTVVVVPTRGGNSLSPRWVTSLTSLIRPMNQKVAGPIFFAGMEVGAAYNLAIESVLEHPELSKFRYLLTWEDDVLPPPDGLLRLYEGMADFDVVGGLYWTKGEGGQPMIYGDMADATVNFRPQIPLSDCLQPAYGLGMGFNLFRLSVFREMKGPWFETIQKWDPSTGVQIYTQDLHFYEMGLKHGLRYACDTRVKCGHYDAGSDIVW